ncbi:hypothetical protein FRC10_003031 [Ceratobasidium sp. 414]|nr:hypothetical protein FRC10_003031 [Ceratobasidium sp. 414]
MLSGGGNKANKDLNLGAEPLKWMMEEAHNAGLSLKLHDVKIGIPDADITGSLNAIWWLLEIVPISRRSYSADGQNSVKKWAPHRGRGRKVTPSHQIHWTVRASLKERSGGANGDKAQQRFTYEPKAKLRQKDNSELLWEDMLIEQPSAPVEESDSPGEQPPEATPKPTWEGGKYLIDAIDLVKDGRSLEPLKQGDSELWVEKLWDYLARDGKPELIWTYGGPSLLHKVAAIPQSRRARGIIRSVVGLKYDPESQAKKQKLEGPGIPATENMGNSINDISPAHLLSYVTPRVCTLLRQWTAGELSPPIASPPANNLMSKVLIALKLKAKTRDEPPPAEVDWSIEYIPKKDRSLQLARISLLTRRCSENARHQLYYADAVLSIMPLLSIKDLCKTRFKLGTEVIRCLEALARDEGCAFEIVDQPNFSELLAFLEPRADIGDQKQQQILVTEAVSAVATLAETCRPSSNWYDEESRSEELFPRIINREVVDKLVQIIAKKKHPAVNNVLRAMKIISQHREHLLLTGDTPAVEHICDSVGVSLDALTILRNFVFYDYVRGIMIEKEVIPHVTSLVESKDTELALMALGFVEELLEYDDSRRELLKGKIALTITAPLNASQPQLVEAALDVAVAITSQSESIEPALVDILVSLASKTKNRKAMLAIGGATAHQQLDHDLGTLIHAFTNFMDDPDNTMVEDALNVLTKLAEHEPSITEFPFARPDDHREEMVREHIIQSLTKLLELGIYPSSYYDPPNTPQGRITITLKAFRLAEVLCTDCERFTSWLGAVLRAIEIIAGIRAQLIQSPAIGFLYSLTDSPISYQVDREAIQTLGRMKYGMYADSIARGNRVIF